MQPAKSFLVVVILMASCAADDRLDIGGSQTDLGPSTATASTTLSAQGTAAPSGAPNPGADNTGAETATTSPVTAPATTAPPSSTTASPSDTAIASPSNTATPTTASPPTTAATTTASPPATAATTTSPEEQGIDGFAVFVDATCDACHGADGKGGSGADLSASTLDIDSVVEAIRFGVPGTEMEGWDFEPKPPGLTRAEIEAVAAYVTSLRSG